MFTSFVLRGKRMDGQTNSTDIAEVFADKYSTLYTSVPYDVNEMSSIRSTLNLSSVISRQEELVSSHDVLSAFRL